jgi:hypothetical protein
MTSEPFDEDDPARGDRRRRHPDCGEVLDVRCDPRGRAMLSAVHPTFVRLAQRDSVRQSTAAS